MGFSARTRTGWGSFWTGTAINFLVIIIAWIIQTAFHVSLVWIGLPLMILIGLLIFLSGTRVFHPIYFTIGLLFGASILFSILILLIALGLITWVVVFG